MVTTIAAPHNAVMKGLDRRIRARRQELLLTMEQVAERAHVAWQSVQSWENGAIPRPGSWEKIAAALETTVDALFYSRELVVPAKPARASESLSLSAVKPTPPLPIIELQGRVPLINWAQAGQWKTVSFHPADAEGWLQVTARIGAHAFALRATGDSMEPRIPEGAYVIIDPARPAEHKTIVLARRPGEPAVLRMVWLDGETPYLRALNPTYPMLPYPADTEIIGVAVQVILDL